MVNVLKKVIGTVHQNPFALFGDDGKRFLEKPAERFPIFCRYVGSLRIDQISPYVPGEKDQLGVAAFEMHQGFARHPIRMTSGQGQASSGGHQAVVQELFSRQGNLQVESSVSGVKVDGDEPILTFHVGRLFPDGGEILGSDLPAGR
jgi:hypothetical protein